MSKRQENILYYREKYFYYNCDFLNRNFDNYSFYLFLHPNDE